MQSTFRYRSFFWPAVLILVGVIAFLVNTGAIPVDRLYLLFDLWPLILIVIGLELIVRRSMHGVAAEVAAAVIVILALAGAVGYVAASPNPSTTHTLDVAGPIGNLEQASLETNVGGANINLAGSSEIGSDLYRAHIEYSGPKPEVDLNNSTGRVTISQSNEGFFRSRGFALNLQMNAGIPWTVTENSGAATDTIDFSHLHIGSLTLNTGASRDDITLGPVSGTVPVEINGSALTLHIHRPAGIATAISISGGPVNLNADGHSSRAVGDLSYQSAEFGAASDRYRITVNGGACSVTLDTTPALT